MEDQGWRLELDGVGLAQVELLELLDLRRKQVSICPRIQNLFYLQFEAQQISRSAGEPGRVLCREEITEV